jgi:hypothetical protein
MRAFMVSSQARDSVIDRLKTEPFGMRVDLILERRQKPFLTAALFQQYIRTVLIAFINRARMNDQLAGKPAISLMDNCSIHTRPEVFKMLREQEVKVIPFQFHTAQVFQALDLNTFGILKKNCNI